MKTLFLSLLVLISFTSVAQWSFNPFEQKVFIENKGQFDEKNNSTNSILYGVNNLGYQIYFTKTGFTIRYDLTTVDPEEKIRIGKQREAGEKKDKLTRTSNTYEVHYQWLNTSTNISLHAERSKPHLFHYANSKAKHESIYNCRAFEKLLYKLYLQIFSQLKIKIKDTQYNCAV